MSSRIWLAIGVGLVFGVIGFLIGKGQQPAPPPAPPPPPPPPVVATSCVGNAVLTYDAAAKSISLDQKPYRVDWPANDAAQSGACWSLKVVNAAQPVEFEKLKIKLSPPAGRNGRPVVVGDPDFQGGKKVVWVRFDDEPVWTDIVDGNETYQGIRYPFDIEAKVKGVAEPIAVDPDMILRKGN
jgi:hypothetical protein